MIFEVTTFPKRQKIYKMLKYDRNHKKIPYYNQLEDYRLQLNAYESRLQQWQKERMAYCDRAREILSIAQYITSPDNKIDQMNRKKSEVKFEKLLRKYWGSKILLDIKLKNEGEDNSIYSLNLAYMDGDFGLNIAIKIDRPDDHSEESLILPYEDNNKQIDDCFLLERLWLVIHFAQEEVMLFPERCCKLIASAIAEITLENEIL